MQDNKIIQVEDYKRFVGAETIERVREKVKPLQDLHVVNVVMCQDIVSTPVA